MKRLIAAAALSFAMPALAQTPGAAPKFTTGTPIEQLVSDPAAKAVLDADLPGLTTHPMYDMFKRMSLAEVAPMSDGKITDERLAKVDADLAKLK